MENNNAACAVAVTAEGDCENQMQKVFPSAVATAVVLDQPFAQHQQQGPQTAYYQPVAQPNSTPLAPHASGVSVRNGCVAGGISTTSLGLIIAVAGGIFVGIGFGVLNSCEDFACVLLCFLMIFFSFHRFHIFIIYY